MSSVIKLFRTWFNNQLVRFAKNAAKIVHSLMADLFIHMQSSKSQRRRHGFAREKNLTPTFCLLGESPGNMKQNIVHVLLL